MAGYGTGKGLGEWLNSDNFSSKFAKSVSRIGQVLGIIIAGVGGLLGLLEYYSDDEITWIFLLISLFGILFMIGMHWVALKLDKKDSGKNE